MNILHDNPVLGRELRARLRLRKLRDNKPLAIGTGLVVLVIAWFYVKGLISIHNGMPQDARDIWSGLVMFLLLLIVVITPAVQSTAITREREQQTWEALATTRLTGIQVLLGKWLGRLSLAVLPILILLPFLVGCAAKGGLTPFNLFADLFFLLVTSAGYGVLGLLCSFLVRKSVSATVTALAVTLLICVGTPVIGFLISAYLQAAAQQFTPQDPAIYWINPFYALTALNMALAPTRQDAPTINGPASTIAIFYLIITSLSAAAGLAFMIRRYRRVARE